MNKWIKAASIRAIKTICQTIISLISVGTLMSDINWLEVGSASLLAGILSILTSIAGLPEVEDFHNTEIEHEVEESEE